jgi:uncharacterized membrane-anchored protein
MLGGATVVVAAIALLDLFTGFFYGDRRLDALLLATCVGMGASVYEIRHFALQARTNQVSRPGFATRLLSIGTSVLMLAVFAGVGYLLGGAWLAVALPIVFIAFMSVWVGFGLRRKRAAD